MYICYSTRMSGWFSPQSNYTSNWKEAKHFTLEEALMFCKVHKNGTALGMFPVSIDTLEAI